MHTLNPSCAPTMPKPRARRRVVARAELYRGTHETVSWPPPDRVAGVPCHVVGVPCHVAARKRALFRTYRSPQRRILVHRGRIAAPGCPISQHMVAPSQPRYNFVLRPNSQQPGPYAREPTVSCPSDGHIMVQARPCRGPLAVPRPAFPASVSRYKLLYRDPVHAEKGSSLAATCNVSPFFFFTHFFFIPATEKNHPKIINK